MSDYPFVSRCVPKAKNSSKGNKQFDADLRTKQVQFLESGGSANTENFISSSSALKVRRIEIINGKKYKVIS
jgi:hypothetical protein